MRCGGHMHLTTLAAAAVANSGGVTGAQQLSAPVAFAWGSNKFTASRRAPALPCAISRNPWMSRVKTTDTRNTRHSSSSSSRSSRRKMSPHGDKYFIRECGDDGEEYREIIGSVDSWWGGRRMTPMLPRLFFDHFFKTSFVAVMKQEDEQVDGPPPTLASTTLTTRSKNPTRTTAGQTTTTKTPTTTAVVGFVCGFVSPSRPGRAYVHFVGVDPDHRGAGLGAALYESFIDRVRSGGCLAVRSVTSPSNTASVAFHERIGFRAIPVATSSSISTTLGTINSDAESETTATTDFDAEGETGVEGEKESALERGADGSSRVADKYVHVGWDGPDGGDRVLLEKDI